MGRAGRIPSRLVCETDLPTGQKPANHAHAMKLVVLPFPGTSPFLAGHRSGMFLLSGHADEVAHEPQDLRPQAGGVIGLPQELRQRPSPHKPTHRPRAARGGSRERVRRTGNRRRLVAPLPPRVVGTFCEQRLPGAVCAAGAANILAWLKKPEQAHSPVVAKAARRKVKALLLVHQGFLHRCQDRGASR